MFLMYRKMSVQHPTNLDQKYYMESNLRAKICWFLLALCLMSCMTNSIKISCCISDIDQIIHVFHCPCAMAIGVIIYI